MVDYRNMPYWPIIIIFLIIYILWTDDKSQNCKDKPCLNSPYFYTNDNNDLVNIIHNNIDRYHILVNWRLCLLTAILLALILLFLFTDTFPHGFVVLLTIIIIFTFIYFIDMMYLDILIKDKCDQIKKLIFL